MARKIKRRFLVDMNRFHPQTDGIFIQQGFYHKNSIDLDYYDGVSQFTFDSLSGDQNSIEVPMDSDHDILQVDLNRFRCRIRFIDDAQSCVTFAGKDEYLGPKEIKLALDPKTANDLLQATGGNLIERIQYKSHYAGYIWTVCQYKSGLKGLTIASLLIDEDKQNFPKPAWIGQEITDDRRYYHRTIHRKKPPIPSRTAQQRYRNRPKINVR